MKAIVSLEIMRTYTKTLRHNVEVEFEPQDPEGAAWEAEVVAEKHMFNGEYEREIERAFADEPIDDDDEVYNGATFIEFVDDE